MWFSVCKGAKSAKDAQDTEGGPGSDMAPAQAFDALYARGAPALVRQAFLLTGRPRSAHESVERAFQRAWQHWPEVAVDRDPVGWVRAAAHEYALSPWRRTLSRGRRRVHPRSPGPPPDPADRDLLDALLTLPAPYRRTLLLYDGLGLGLAETAAETEASTPAAAGRLLNAREAVAARLPELADAEALRHRLREALAEDPAPAAHPRATFAADLVRVGGERRARLWVRTAAAFTVLLVTTTVLTLNTASDRYEAPVSPGAAVRGLPPRVAPGPLSHEQLKLRDKLRSRVARGPHRLVPEGH